MSLTGKTELLGDGDHVAAWQSIRTEYAELIGDYSHLEMLTLVKAKDNLQARITAVQMCVDGLQKGYVPQFKQILDFYGFRYNWELIPQEQYDSQLAAIVGRAKTWVADLMQKQKQWETMVMQADSKEGVSRKYFEELLLILSKQQGYHIKAKEITVYTFAVLLNLAKKENGRKPNK